MCQRCGKNYGVIEISLTDRKETKQFCPNCMVLACYENINEILENSNKFTCDISGHIGAIHYKSRQEEYFLEKAVMIRLLKRNLNPDEYFILAKKYGENQYMIHEDFYDELGNALQPIED